MNTLTEYERQFADQNHDVVYRFLRAKGLNVNEYYDVVIFRYLAAVQRYLSKPKLRKYSFTTIAWNAMRSALYNHRRSEKRKSDFCFTDTALVESLTGYDSGEQPSDTPKLLWMEVASMLTEPERTLARQRADGWTYREIADECGRASSTMSNRMGRLRERVTGLCSTNTALIKFIEER